MQVDSKELEVQSEVGTIEKQLKLNHADSKGGKKSVVLPLKRKHSVAESKQQEVQPERKSSRFTRSKLQTQNSEQQPTQAPEN